MLDYKTGSSSPRASGWRCWARPRGRTAHRPDVDTPKADFWTFRDGKIVEFYELYDTAALLAAAGR